MKKVGRNKKLNIDGKKYTIKQIESMSEDKLDEIFKEIEKKIDFDTFWVKYKMAMYEKNGTLLSNNDKDIIEGSINAENANPDAKRVGISEHLEEVKNIITNVKKN